MKQSRALQSTQRKKSKATSDLNRLSPFSFPKKCASDSVENEQHRRQRISRRSRSESSDITSGDFLRSDRKLCSSQYDVERFSNADSTKHDSSECKRG